MLFKKGKQSYTVYTAGAPVLREKAVPVTAIDDRIRNLAAEMYEAMRVFNGIGLAAPQYGESLRMVVFDVPQDSNTGTPGEMLLLPQMPLTVVNPEIVAYSEETSEYDEGCLSVPDIYAPVIRPVRVVFRAQKLDGEFVEVECGGLLGRCLQHETDHLDGILFTDRLAPAAAGKIEGQLKRLIEYGKSHDFRRVTRK